jgi:hypothetical protein
VQTSAGPAGVVRDAARLCAAVRARRRTAASSPALGGANAAEMGRGWPALDLGRNLTAAQAIPQLTYAAEGLWERVACGQTPTKGRLQGAHVEQEWVTQPVITPLRELVDNLVGRAVQVRVFQQRQRHIDVYDSTDSSSRICLAANAADSRRSQRSW